MQGGKGTARARICKVRRGNSRMRQGVAEFDPAGAQGGHSAPLCIPQKGRGAENIGGFAIAIGNARR